MPNLKLVDLFNMIGTGLSLVCCLVIWGSTGVFLWYLSGGVLHPMSLQVSQYVSVEPSSLTHHRSHKAYNESEMRARQKSIVTFY